MKFDLYTTRYEEELGKALRVSGEARDYFATGRVTWLAKCLHALEVTPQRLLDYGCGDGRTTPMLLEQLGAERALGVDISTGMIGVAIEHYASAAVTYLPLSELQPKSDIDVAYCNGVFHHVPPAERDDTVGIVRDSLRPGGLFALWENNPWNPATRYVMSRCEFDDDAIMLAPSDARSLLAKNGFEIVRTDYRFIFPRALRMLRPLEKLMYRAPLGAQYQVLAQKI